MKKIIIKYALAATFAGLASPCIATDCITGAVTNVRIGYGNADWGNSIEVRIDTTGTQWWPIYRDHNLNDSPGYGLLHLLTVSRMSGNSVTLSDNTGRCREIDSVWLK
ncbi:hypothetical protein [Dyella acidiphila]|uniref:Uncharacterized protein n=1 Tax=Dyella acidiphila TaxID=2775866 RepID=A0ABR9G9Q4_9GAMM|nr:hypothetical protein [Dyella acidiphila]MBE1160781.1 hypothetical protein [Dyella acidiphila]